MERVREFYTFFDLSMPVDLLVFSEVEIARRVASGDTWLIHIWNESIELAP